MPPPPQQRQQQPQPPRVRRCRPRCPPSPPPQPPLPPRRDPRRRLRVARLLPHPGTIFGFSTNNGVGTVYDLEIIGRPKRRGWREGLHPACSLPQFRYACACNVVFGVANQVGYTNNTSHVAHGQLDNLCFTVRDFRVPAAGHDVRQQLSPLGSRSSSPGSRYPFLAEPQPGRESSAAKP